MLCVMHEQEELERQQVEAQRRLEERSGQLNAQEKEALLERFKRDQVQHFSETTLTPLDAIDHCSWQRHRTLPQRQSRLVHPPTYVLWLLVFRHYDPRCAVTLILGSNETLNGKHNTKIDINF